MKKRRISLILTVSMAFILSACAASKPNVSTKPNALTGQNALTRQNASAKSSASVTPSAEKMKNKREAIMEAAAAEVIFGSENAANYQGFTYLTEAIIATADTTSGKKVSFHVYIPEENYSYVSSDSARSTRMGVTFEIDIAPYLQYGAKEHTVEENLQEYVDGITRYAYSKKYDMTVGETVRLADNMAYCEVSYMEYNAYHDEYAPIYVQYNLKEMEDGIYVLFTIEIKADETTGKTTELLEELSSFYQIDMHYEDSFAQDKWTEFKNSDEYNPDAVQLGFMSFVLPEGWAEDEDERKYESYVFAPNGDYSTADAVIAIFYEWEYEEDVVGGILTEEAYARRYLEKIFSDNVTFDNIMIEDEQETFIGKTAKISMTARENDEEITFILYTGQKKYRVYSICACIMENNGGVEEAIAKIFETGCVR